MKTISDINKEKNFVSIVVYTFNDEKTIGYFLKTVSSYISTYFEKYEIICVNDASTDNTAAIIESVGKTISSPVSILNLSYHQGIEKAMFAGINLSIGDFVYEFDSTIIDYDTKVILDIYKELLGGGK